MADEQDNGLGTTIGGDTFGQDQAEQALSQSIQRAHRVGSEVADAFQGEWSTNPTTGLRAAYGHWMLKSFRHLMAIVALAKTMDLSKVAEVHYRQILEILFQVRKLSSYPYDEQDEVAKTIAIWGLLDYLEKLEIVKTADFAEGGYKDAEDRLHQFDRSLIDSVREVRASGQLYWFGRTMTSLAREVSKPPEDMGKVYRIASAHVHGSWDLAIDVVSPEPGMLDFRGYPNKAQMLYWAGELVDRATTMYVRTWNEVADTVGGELCQEGS